MQTFKNTKDLSLQAFPKSPADWATNPIIVFSMPVEKSIEKGDRIYCAIKMVTTGPNSGTIREIYYYIKEVQEVKRNESCLDLTITAKASRLEI
ncbi:hypothetical protein AMR72_16435 [Flavobacterium psychrophilum]|nr:hypothetical protein AMR72_16435 [Flavobacterium psychrophilum]AOE53952.1 hypothetical protein ALW18_16425 [Flavobacterium psychrophilum]